MRAAPQVCHVTGDAHVISTSMSRDVLATWKRKFVWTLLEVIALKGRYHLARMRGGLPLGQAPPR